MRLSSLIFSIAAATALTVVPASAATLKVVVKSVFANSGTSADRQVVLPTLTLYLANDQINPTFPTFAGTDLVKREWAGLQALGSDARVALYGSFQEDLIDDAEFTLGKNILGNINQDLPVFDVGGAFGPGFRYVETALVNGVERTILDLFSDTGNRFTLSADFNFDGFNDAGAQRLFGQPNLAEYNPTATSFATAPGPTTTPGTGTVSTVPLPAAFWMLSASLAGLGLRRRT